MFSGKTTELIRLIDRKNIAGKKCLIIKHSIDDRYDKDANPHVTTHNQYSYNKTSIIYVPRLTDALAEDIIKEKNVVAIEEGHFFPDLCEWCLELANNGLDVIISALNGNFKQEPYDEIGKLMANAEIVNKLAAVCMRCKNTVRKNYIKCDILIVFSVGFGLFEPKILHWRSLKNVIKYIILSHFFEPIDKYYL